MIEKIIKDIENGVSEVAPFSNGSEAYNWICDNCTNCTKSYFDVNYEVEPSDYSHKEIVQLIREGQECPAKYALDLGFITGGISKNTSKFIWNTKEDKSNLRTCSKRNYTNENYLGTG